MGPMRILLRQVSVFEVFMQKSILVCQPDTDVILSAIYKCHPSVAGLGRRARAEALRYAGALPAPD
jgi:hypothetical protein